jgi:carbon storage regulator
MTVIRRMRNEGVVINGDIILTVIEVRGDEVRLAIEYPRGVSIQQGEVYQAPQVQARTGPEPDPRS